MKKLINLFTILIFTLTLSFSVTQNLSTDLLKCNGSKSHFLDDVSTVGKVGKNILSDVKYTDKVLNQMRKGDFHSFPKEVDNFGNLGKISEIKGGDGLLRTKVEIPGGYKGKDGVFQYIIENDNTVNHKIFVQFK